LDDYSYSISLRIWHPNADPDRFTMQLGKAPSRAWRAGAPRTTPVGTPLEGVNRRTYWASGNLERGAWPGRRLSDALNALLDDLEPHKLLFQGVRTDGGRVEFFVGWYFTKNSGDVVDVETLRRLSDCGIDLSLDIYPPDQPQHGI
jgi:hypothetical protein